MYVNVEIKLFYIIIPTYCFIYVKKRLQSDID